MDSLNINNQLNKIAEILTHCRRLTFDSHSIIVAKTNAKHIVVSRDKFLTLTGEAFWKLAVIELTKIYSANNESDHLSIIVFINYLRRNHSKSQWNNLVTSEELKQMSIILNTTDTKDRIKKLKELRNQHFAHTDNEPDNYIHDIKFYFEDCVFLIQKAENLISNLSVKILKDPIIFSNYEGEAVDSFLDKHLEFIKLAGIYKMEQNKI